MLLRCLELSSPASRPDFHFDVRKHKNVANRESDPEVEATVLLDRDEATMNQMLCDHRAEETGEGKGEVPPPVEGGASVGDHLVKMMKGHFTGHVMQKPCAGLQQTDQESLSKSIK